MSLDVVLTSVGSFLFGGASVALFSYVKFNGRLVRMETKQHEMYNDVKAIKLKLDVI